MRATEQLLQHGDAERVVAITGAAGGLGRALTRTFLNGGFRVVALGKSKSPPDGSAYEGMASRFHWYQLDVSDWASVEQVFSRVTQELHRIDVLFNNAAVYPREAFLEASMADWVRAIHVNLVGPAYCSRAVLPGMIARGYGRIFNVGSFADGAPIQKSSAYSVSKGGLHALSKAIGADLQDLDLGSNVQVHEWIPGHINTPMSGFTGLDPMVSSAWALKIVLADNASSNSVLYVNDKEYVPPKRLKRRVLDFLLSRG